MECASIGTPSTKRKETSQIPNEEKVHKVQDQETNCGEAEIWNVLPEGRIGEPLFEVSKHPLPESKKQTG